MSVSLTLNPSPKRARGASSVAGMTFTSMALVQRMPRIRTDGTYPTPSIYGLAGRVLVLLQEVRQRS